MLPEAAVRAPAPAAPGAAGAAAVGVRRMRVGVECGPARRPGRRPDAPAPALILSPVTTAAIRAAVVASGHVWTRQRAAVVAALRHSRDPLDADEVRHRAAQRVPRISQTTVGKTVALLHAHGFVREGGTDPEWCRWPEQVRLVCGVCGAAATLRSRHLAPLLEDVYAQHRFEPAGGDLVLTARCASCPPAPL
jgi:Fe2+ or Zn2+ uptake regulation protein